MWPKPRLLQEVNPEQLALLVREWQLSYVTPLYRFNHGHLKSYSRQLAAFLVSERQQGFEVGLESTLKVTFTLVAGMAQTEEEANTVFIQVADDVRGSPPFPMKETPPPWPILFQHVIVYDRIVFSSEEVP